jgi:ribosomal protein S18 acetylase RimI-like enzyme
MGDRTALTIREARPEDVGPAVEVQHRAFTRVAIELGFDPALLPPVSETVEEVGALLAERAARLLVAFAGDGTLVGTVRGVPGERGTVEVGRLAVEDGWDGRGIRKELMVRLEALFPHADRFELFTGSEAEGPLHLYESLGYRVMRDEEVMTGVRLVWLEKCRAPRVDSHS